MADFIVRVELQEGTVADYEKLDYMMHTDGFSRKITQNNTTYNLPLRNIILEQRIMWMKC
jgi:hypothetical protein